MSPLSNSPNHFLASLSREDAVSIQPHLKPMDLPQGGVFFRAEEAISRVYFPHSGVVSLVVGLSDGQYVEAGMFGRNRVIGVAAFLDGPVALNQAIGQVAGTGLVGEANGAEAAGRRERNTSRVFGATRADDFAHVQQVAACNAAHTLEERLSRWLLQTRDLLASDDLPLTQEFLSQMLAVQRSSVTLVARRLQEAGSIKYTRGRIHVRDADALHELCCECYDVINAHFRKLSGWGSNHPGAVQASPEASASGRQLMQSLSDFGRSDKASRRIGLRPEYPPSESYSGRT